MCSCIHCKQLSQLWLNNNMFEFLFLSFLVYLKLSIGWADLICFFYYLPDYRPGC